MKDESLARLGLERDDPEQHSWLVVLCVHDTTHITAHVNNAKVKVKGLMCKGQEVPIGTKDPQIEIRAEQCCPVAQASLRTRGYGEDGGAWGLQEGAMEKPPGDNCWRTGASPYRDPKTVPKDHYMHPQYEEPDDETGDKKDDLALPDE